MLSSMEHWTNYWLNFFDLSKKKKIDHTNAKFKIVKTTTTEAVFYSDAETLDKAKAEGWTAFNINKEGVKKSQTGVNLIVIENPHRMIDDDGYDTVTGIRKQGDDN